jgi:hypothetical protein
VERSLTSGRVGQRQDLFAAWRVDADRITSVGTRYLDFLAPGIFGQSVLFVAIF